MVRRRGAFCQFRANFSQAEDLRKVDDRENICPHSAFGTLHVPLLRIASERENGQKRYMESFVLQAESDLLIFHPRAIIRKVIMINGNRSAVKS